MPGKMLLIILAGAAALAGLSWLALRDGEAPGLDPVRIGEGEAARRAEAPNGDRPGTPTAPAVPLAERVRSVLSDYLGDLRGGNSEPDPAAWEALANDAEGVAALLQRLASPGANSDEKAAILLLLGLSRLPDASEALASAARGDFGPKLRTAAFLGLAAGDVERALPILERVATREEEDALAGVALQVLASAGPEFAVGAFARVLEIASEPDRRKMVYILMAGGLPDVHVEEPGLVTRHRRGLPPPPPVHPIGDPESEAAFLRLIGQAAAETDPALAVVAGEALSRMPGEPARRAFTRLLGRSGEKVKGTLLGVVTPSQSPELYGELVREADTMRDPAHRRRIAEHLGAARDPKLVPALRAWLAVETDSGNRSAITKTLERLR